MARSADGSGAGSAPRTPTDQPALPFDPPESVRKWLCQEDYEALNRAWLEAEAQACSGEVEDQDEDLLDGESSSTSPSSMMRRARVRRKRQPWKDDFQMLGMDNRAAPAHRRYFDSTPAELSAPRQAVRRGMAPPPDPNEREKSISPQQQQHRPKWDQQWSSLASRDNNGLHQHLRHYFDRRGMEASFRMRPHVDSEWLQRQRPRSSQRPSNQEAALKHSKSAPAVASGSRPRGGEGGRQAAEDPLDVKFRHQGNINWGTRCLRYGPGASEKPKEKIPWVTDHHVHEAEDNHGLNPVLRHYFDADGLETSFRNRGRHYGRPLPAVLGVGGGLPKSSSTSTGGQP